MGTLKTAAFFTSHDVEKNGYGCLSRLNALAVKLKKLGWFVAITDASYSMYQTIKEKSKIIAHDNGGTELTFLINTPNKSRILRVNQTLDEPLCIPKNQYYMSGRDYIILNDKIGKYSWKPRSKARYTISLGCSERGKQFEYSLRKLLGPSREIVSWSFRGQEAHFKKLCSVNFVITRGGVTLRECLALGIPVIICDRKDNDAENYYNLSQKYPWIKVARNLSETVKQVDWFQKNCKEFVGNVEKIVSPNGAEKVAKVLNDIYLEEVKEEKEDVS